MNKPRHPKKLVDRLTPALLKQLRERKITNAEVAQRLNYNANYLSRTVARIQSKEPGQSMIRRRATQKLVAARRQTRMQLARRVMAGRLTIEEAAEQGNCHIRTIYRYIEMYNDEPQPRKKAA